MYIFDFLLVGGGAGGGGARQYGELGGGGGGGGLLFEAGFTLNTETVYPVVVGLGGNGAPADNVNGTNGGDTTFAGFTSIGGGGGGHFIGSAGNVGGSGGGAGANKGFANSGSSGTAGQGNSGGGSRSGNSQGANDFGASGGGGGAGENGGDADDRGGSTPAGGGGGGNGLDYSSYFGTSVGDSGYFSGGGYGRSWNGPQGAVALGIGVNTGGGGIGGRGGGGGNGHKGTFIIRFPATAQIEVLQGGDNVYTYDGYIVHQYTSDGNFEFEEAAGGGTARRSHLMAM